MNEPKDLPSIERLDELRSQCIDRSITGMLIDASELAQLIEAAYEKLDRHQYTVECGSQHDRELAEAREAITAAKKAYGKEFTENAALLGERDELARERLEYAKAVVVAFAELGIEDEPVAVRARKLVEGK